jgi:CBS domain-containing protein
MHVADIMHTDLKTISADATVADAVAALALARVSAMPVLDRHGRAVGICTTRDVLLAESRCENADARERLFESTLVLEIMTPWPDTIAPDADLRAAARKMLDHGVQRLFVSEGGQLVGVVSQTDIVDAVAAARI